MNRLSAALDYFVFKGSSHLPGGPRRGRGSLSRCFWTCRSADPCEGLKGEALGLCRGAFTMSPALRPCRQFACLQPGGSSVCSPSDTTTRRDNESNGRGCYCCDAAAVSPLSIVSSFVATPTRLKSLPLFFMRVHDRWCQRRCSNTRQQTHPSSTSPPLTRPVQRPFYRNDMLMRLACDSCVLHCRVGVDR